MPSIFKFLGVILTLLIVYSLVLNSQEVRRLYHLNFLFSESAIIENFRNMDKLFRVKEIPASEKTYNIPIIDNPIALPETFPFEGHQVSTDYFLRYTKTGSVIVSHKGRIVAEEYYNDEKENDTHISWSVAKSFVSALMGIAIHEGKISSIEDPVTNYVPELKGSGYDGVRIKDVLQMSSGVKFNEDYANPFSDINIFGYVMAFGSSYDEFCARLERAREPGTFNEYISIDTQVLAMVLSRATGQNLTEYLYQKIINPLGFEQEGFWITDKHDVELALGGLNFIARDFHKFGLLYANSGNWNGEQIIPEQWITDSITPDAPHLMPGENENSDSTWGYGYQWWIPETPKGDYLAIGVYNQYIYVDPENDIVISKFSANDKYLTDEYISDWQSVELFRAITQKVLAEINTN